jgi:hypothetical protein
MKSNNIFFYIILLFIVPIFAKAETSLKCSDTNALYQVRAILLQHMGSNEDPNNYNDKLVVSDVHAVDFNEHIQKLSCQAILSVQITPDGQGWKYPLVYDYQIDDSGNKNVYLQNLSTREYMQIRMALIQLKNIQPQTSKNTIANELGNQDKHSDNSFIGRCMLEVNKVKYLNGQCFISIEQNGNLFIGPKEQDKISYFALLNVTGKNIGEGSWNEEEGASHAHTPLGNMQRNGACWENSTAKICAWK